MTTLITVLWLQYSAASECRFVDSVERSRDHGNVAVLISKATGETTTIRHAPAWWVEGGLIGTCNR